MVTRNKVPSCFISVKKKKKKKSFKTEMRVSCLFPSYVWCLDILVMKSLELQTEMYKSDLHLLSELFPWVLDSGLVIVSITEMFTCWGSHFPLVSRLSLSSNRHNQTQRLVWMKTLNAVEMTYSVKSIVMMLQMLMPSTAETIGTSLESMNVAREKRPPPVLSHNIFAPFPYSGALPFSPDVVCVV